jgi:hypothetical protein
MPEIIPRNGFRLFQKWRYVGKSRSQVTTSHSRALQLMNTCHRLSGTPVCYNAGESLGTLVKANEVRSRIIFNSSRLRLRSSPLQYRLR